MLGADFVKWYLIFILPSVILMAIDIFDRIKYRKMKSVRVSLILMAVCFFGSFIALFGSLSNGLAYFKSGDAELWFVIMMSICYVGLVAMLIIMHDERIIYSADDGAVFTHRKLKGKKFFVSEITRIYLSDEYLDIYLGKERIRFGNNFLKGANDFEKFVKDYFLNHADM